MTEEKIKNPFVEEEGYRCFGCAPEEMNPYGLNMEFTKEGDEIVSLWEPKDHFQGFKNVLHGGIQAALIDEIASWVVFVHCETGGFTAGLNVRYLKNVLTDKGPVTLKARLKEMVKNRAFVEVSLIDGTGNVCTEAVAEYFTLPSYIAEKKLHYPGKDAFRYE